MWRDSKPPGKCCEIVRKSQQALRSNLPGSLISLQAPNNRYTAYQNDTWNHWKRSPPESPFTAGTLDGHHTSRSIAATHSSRSLRSSVIPLLTSCRVQACRSASNSGIATTCSLTSSETSMGIPSNRQTYEYCTSGTMCSEEPARNYSPECAKRLANTLLFNP